MDGTRLGQGLREAVALAQTRANGRLDVVPQWEDLRDI